MTLGTFLVTEKGTVIFSSNTLFVCWFNRVDYVESIRRHLPSTKSSWMCVRNIMAYKMVNATSSEGYARASLYYYPRPGKRFDIPDAGGKYVKKGREGCDGAEFWEEISAWFGDRFGKGWTRLRHI